MVQISFIIPCKNEELYIGRCLEAILSQPKQEDIEIIVVDNGSTDSSIEIIQSFCEKRVIFFHCQYNKISLVRNFGAQVAQGEWLVFVDGDVEIGPNWVVCFENWKQGLRSKGHYLRDTCTGSTCIIPANPTWIESSWFGQLQARDERNQRYINSGHFVISRYLFDMVGGFNPGFTTGEDEKICSDIVASGGGISKEPDLVAIHHGYPKSYRDFFLRERWHGKGMRSHLKRPWKYRDLQLALYNLFLFMFFIIGTVFFGFSAYGFSVFALAFFFPIFVFSLFRTKFSPHAAVLLTLLWANYGIAKSVSLLEIFRDWVRDPTG